MINKTNYLWIYYDVNKNIIRCLTTAQCHVKLADFVIKNWDTLAEKIS